MARGRPMSSGKRRQLAGQFADKYLKYYDGDNGDAIAKYAKKLATKTNTFHKVINVKNKSGLTYMQCVVYSYIGGERCKPMSPRAAYTKAVNEVIADIYHTMKIGGESRFTGGNYMKLLKHQKASIATCKYDELAKVVDPIKHMVNATFASYVPASGIIAYVDDTTYLPTTRVLLDAGCKATRLSLINAGCIRGILPVGVTHVKKLNLEYFEGLADDAIFGGIYIDATSSYKNLRRDLEHAVYHCAPKSCLAFTHSHRKSGPHEGQYADCLTVVAIAASARGLTAELRHVFPNTSVTTYIWTFSEAT